MKLSDFDYNFPDDLIAAHPLPDRDASRMMVINRADEGIAHGRIKDITGYLKKGDLLVLNDTRVFPARLVGRKESGGYFEILLLKEVKSPHNPPLKKGGRGGFQILPPLKRGGRGGFWRCITNQTRTARPGLRVLFGDGLAGTIVSRDGDELVIEFNKPELIEDVGLPPVPPYIRARRSAAAEPAVTGVLDKDRYQTIYARHTGSAAAPTAGLHFTERLLKEIISAGADIAHVTLHVGLDTFSPVRTEDILKHKMHGEGYFVPDDTVAAIERTRSNGGRVIAVGTTSVRALESHPPLKKGGRGGFTELFITPGYKFRVVDVILTNFHQPRSTLLMLVSAFAGREFILRAYKEAIKERYRLFSYGDCMLIM